MTNKTATIIWVYEVASDLRHTVRRLLVVGDNHPRPQSAWRKPTIDDGTVSVLDKIRGSPAIVIA